jgi:IS1 family transposase
LLKSGKPGSIFELDELYWFIKKKAETETRENVYLMTMICPEPRMIVGFEVAMDKGAAHIQRIVDAAPEVDFYHTDGYMGYLDVVFPGDHVRNVRDKKDTHNVESINADLRHYIPVLRRRSRCFCRSLETLQAVVEVFVDAYNAFGIAKLKHRVPTQHRSLERPKHLHKFRDPACSILDFL